LGEGGPWHPPAPCILRHWERGEVIFQIIMRYFSKKIRKIMVWWKMNSQLSSSHVRSYFRKNGLKQWMRSISPCKTIRFGNLSHYHKVWNSLVVSDFLRPRGIPKLMRGGIRLVFWKRVILKRKGLTLKSISLQFHWKTLLGQ